MGQYWVTDLPTREVVVHTVPTATVYRRIERQAWTAPLSVLGVEVELATLLARR